ncbi:putative NodB-like protein [Seiridium unicorne]|uniref:NodB-like protein n=1 Tax=Seiridium unicorne TaxID=138068 RepID=A0ABR2UI15_9PEZI
MTKKVLCGFGIDLDAVSGWINTAGAAPANATNVSRGIFGATVGLDRVLTLLHRPNIKATFFIPAHTLESFPQQVAKVHEAGHEIGLHGYTHEHVSALSEEQERAVLVKSIDVITKFTGKHPRGWTAPAWTTSPKTVQLLEEHGLIYDHSFMHHDCQPYYLPYNPSYIETNHSLEADEWMQPMSQLELSKVVEIPANWHLDDWPPLNIGQGVGNGLIDPDVVFKLWTAQFDFYYREYDNFIFPISIHPQVSGKAQVQLLLEKVIAHINSHEGVQWVPFEEMVGQFKDGEIRGHEVHGGAKPT